MIWIVFVILALLALLVLAPAFTGAVETDDEEIETYFAQIDALEDDPDLDGPAKAAARLTLQRQILKAEQVGSGRGGALIASIAAVALLAGGAGIYSQIGHPEPLAQEATEADSLLAELEDRLRTDRREDPVGWTLYARALASLGRTQEAVMAYDVALQLNDDPALRAEAEGVLRGPTADDIAAAMDMTEDDRAAMIRG
ncbi:MAG: c-type cytochrome biogenesis protein CcmI, partial [Litorimonas sp.]